MGDAGGESGVFTAELKWTSISSSSSIVGSGTSSTAGSGTASLFNVISVYFVWWRISLLRGKVPLSSNNVGEQQKFFLSSLFSAPTPG